MIWMMRIHRCGFKANLVVFVWTGLGPYLCLWDDISLTWTRCARNAGSGLVPHSPDLVLCVAKYHSAESGQTCRLIPHGSWHSCGGARCLGVLCWKGTPQDCVDHMKRTHDIPPLMKAAHLARWFPPWTVTREQWSSLMWSAVSGIAVDTLLFSRIGVPLLHRYWVFDRPATHGAFRGTYMQGMHTFLEDSDAASLRARHRRRARVIAARMLQTTLQDTGGRAPDISSRPSTSRRSGSRSRKSTPSAAVAVIDGPRSCSF